jgi:2-amino-4-hydroxy-6-hydroxymethyldihydropteridine diphosphokinase
MTVMARVFLSLGSNLGDRQGYLEYALRQLVIRGVHITARSPIYETEPWPEQRVPRERWFLNRAVAIETELSPYRLLGVLQEIENAAGRVRPTAPSPQYADRTLDIDILLYEDRIVSDDRLQIPHPLLHERRFVLMPLADIAPEVEHPTLYQTIREILAEVGDPGGIFPYPD